MRSCKYPECKNKHYARDYCKKHYLFLIRNELEPTPDNIDLIRKERNKRISHSTTGVRKIRKALFSINKVPEILRKDGRFELITALSLLKLELEMYENNLLGICDNKTPEEIEEKIKDIKENIEAIIKEMGKLKMQGFPKKDIEYGKHIQTKI